MNAKIMGTGYELPAFRADNDYLATLVDTSDEWIRERTGICARHLAKEETTTSMAAKAARKALQKAGVDASEVELVIVGHDYRRYGYTEYGLQSTGADRCRPCGGI